jgi:hypothetical protein
MGSDEFELADGSSKVCTTAGKHGVHCLTSGE